MTTGPRGIAKNHADEIIRLCVDERKTQVEVAKLYGCNPNNIWYILKSRGVNLKPIVHRDTAIQLYLEGASLEKIGKIFRVSGETIRRLIGEWGIERPPRTHITCNVCRNRKPLEEYYIHKSGKQAGQYKYTCKKCSLAAWRAAGQRHYRVQPYVEAPTVTEKFCKACGFIHPASAFHKHRKTTDGLQHWCKECLAEYTWDREHANQSN